MSLGELQDCNCGEGMREKVGLCFFLVCFHGSDEDGTKIRGRCGCGRRHGKKLVHSRESESDCVDANNRDEKTRIGV